MQMRMQNEEKSLVSVTSTPEIPGQDGFTISKS